MLKSVSSLIFTLYNVVRFADYFVPLHAEMGI